VYLRKRAPIEVFYNQSGIASKPVRKNLAVHVSLSSILHNVKELTHRRHRLTRRLEAMLPEFLQRTRSQLRLPGRSSALSDCAELWEQQVLASSALAGCIRDALVCQQPIFVFRQKPKLENLKPKLLLISEACFRTRRRLAPRSSAMGGL